MRLLQLSTSGDLTLTKKLYHDIPPYAVLSHTWGTDDDEVTIQDVTAKRGKTKQGYQKIMFCGQQAKLDGLEYFWVDTCCIDKTNSTELAEAINSMFRWYQRAKKCYVFLADVQYGDVQVDRPGRYEWESFLGDSRWFKRGWTLQELIAPRMVDIFSAEGRFLGDKISLEQQLHAITRIPIAVLQGSSLSEFSVEERMSWSNDRETKLAEDMVYCLLGIFDVYMPLIYGEGQDHAYRRLRKELGGDRQKQLESFSTIPFSRDPDFVDRSEILEWLRKKCDGPGTRAGLIGIGGIGKSQAVIEYAYRVRHERPHTWVFWIHASTAARVEEAYRGIADRLSLPDRHNPNANIFQLVSNWLCDESNGRWILILDNADNADVFFPRRQTRDVSTPLGSYLPQSQHGSILVTSRNKDAAFRLVGDLKDVMQVETMGKSQALQLLRNRLHDTSSEDDMLALLDALDCIPLAITQAAAYINRRSRTTVHSYLDEFHRSVQRKGSLLDRDLGDLRRDGNASNSVKTTWRLSFESLCEERSSAADLLSLMSFFHPHGIPEWVLRKSRETVTLTDEDIADAEFDDDLDLLQALSFVSVAVGGDVYEIHALVQFSTRAWLSSLHLEEVWRQRFLGLMAKTFPPGEFQNRAKCQQLLPHLESLFGHEPFGEEAVKDWAQLLTNTAWHMWQQGNYNAAQELAAKAFKAKEKITTYDDMSTLTTMAVLASVLRGQGKYNEAEYLTRRAFGGYKQMLGLHHPDTLTSMSNHALVLRDLGKYDEAEKVQRQALEGRAKELGMLHPDTLMSMSNLALLLRNQGIYNEAEIFNRRALEGREKVLGKRHPSTLTSASNLALLLREQGRYDESEILNRQALEGREVELGKQHPHTLASISNLALVLQDQGKYSEAEMFDRQVLLAYEEKLGHHHPNTLTSVSNLAFVLQDQGQYHEAEKLNRRALEGREVILGKQHPDSLTSLSNLAFTLRLQEKYIDSEKLNRQVLESREEQLGSQHPDTLTSLNNLALVLRDQRKFTEAEAFIRRAFQGYHAELGADHPHTLTSLSNLASILQDQRKYGESEKINRHTLEAYERELGLQHPDTLRSASNLASVLQCQGRYEEAEKFSRRVLEGRQNHLRIQHPDTMKSIDDLASILHDQGRYEEANRLKWHAKKSCEELQL